MELTGQTRRNLENSKHWTREQLLEYSNKHWKLGTICWARFWNSKILAFSCTQEVEVIKNLATSSRKKKFGERSGRTPVRKDA